MTERDNRAVVHGVIENGASENETVGQSDRDADGNAGNESTKHAAGRGTVEIERIVHPSKHCGNNKGLPGHIGKTDVADERFIENLVDGIAIVDGAIRFADKSRAITDRK